MRYRAGSYLHLQWSEKTGGQIRRVQANGSASEALLLCKRLSIIVAESRLAEELCMPLASFSRVLEIDLLRDGRVGKRRKRWK